MDVFAKKVGVNNDTAYTVGLLQGIGKIIVNKCTLEDIEEAVERVRNEFNKRARRGLLPQNDPDSESLQSALYQESS